MFCVLCVCLALARRAEVELLAVQWVSANTADTMARRSRATGGSAKVCKNWWHDGGNKSIGRGWSDVGFEEDTEPPTHGPVGMRGYPRTWRATRSTARTLRNGAQSTLGLGVRVRRECRTNPHPMRRLVDFGTPCLDTDFWAASYPASSALLCSSLKCSGCDVQFPSWLGDGSCGKQRVEHGVFWRERPQCNDAK